jgi:hypothetical protein
VRILEPRPGLVIRYEYSWKDDALAGRAPVHV